MFNYRILCPETTQTDKRHLLKSCELPTNGFWENFEFEWKNVGLKILLACVEVRTPSTLSAIKAIVIAAINRATRSHSELRAAGYLRSAVSKSFKWHWCNCNRSKYFNTSSHWHCHISYLFIYATLNNDRQRANIKKRNKLFNAVIIESV